MNRFTVVSRPAAKPALVAAIVILIVSGCGSSGPGATASSTVSPSPILTNPPMSAPSSTPVPTSTASIKDIMDLEPFAPLQLGTYFIDPDGDASTPLRVVYEVPFAGWRMWIGATKFADEGTTCSSNGCPGRPSHVGLSITTVTNLVSDGCRDHSWADPPVGPSVDDLAAALADLGPFRVTSPPRDVTFAGYRGKQLEWIVPDIPVKGAGDDLRFAGCTDGNLKSWVAFVDRAEPGDAYYGYTGPGYVEEFWILDVKGTRLMVASGRSRGSSEEDVAELQTILHSIRIEP